MATPIHSKSVRVYYDHYKASEFASATNLDIAADSAEITALASTAKEFIQGKYGHSGGFNGFLDLADDGFDEVVHGHLADGEHWLCRAFAGTGIAALSVYETVEIATAPGRASDIGNAVLVNWSGQGTGRACRGVMLSAGEQAFTATGNGTGVNHGVLSSTQTGVLTIRVVAVSGTGSITFRHHGSSDDGSGDAYAQTTGWTSSEKEGTGLTNVNIGTADQLTFTGVGCAKMTRTGALEAWHRINVSAYSTFTSVTALITFTVQG